MDDYYDIGHSYIGHFYIGHSNSSPVTEIKITPFLDTGELPYAIHQNYSQSGHALVSDKLHCSIQKQF